MVEPAGIGAKELTDYGCFGTPVLAPIAAKVHEALDGEADIAIGATLADPSRLLGNHVILKLDGSYLVIAHLKQGSVLVKTGETVSEGQPIGSCGNSGNTSEPHIHIHHQKQDPLSINGDLNLGVNLVEGLPLYFRDHDGAPMPEGGAVLERDAAHPISPPYRQWGGDSSQGHGPMRDAVHLPLSSRWVTGGSGRERGCEGCATRKRLRQHVGRVPAPHCGVWNLGR